MNIKVLILILLMLKIGTFEEPVIYEKVVSDSGESPLVMHILAVDLNNPRVKLFSGLSKGVIYGFEETSHIAEGNKVDIAVNGTFFDDYGHHIGGLKLENRWLTLPDPYLPTFMIDKNNKASMGYLQVEASISHEAGVYPIDGLNRYAYGNELLLFTKEHGSTTRIYEDSLNYMIQDGVIVGIVKTQGEPARIDENQQVLVDVGDKRGLPFAIGDKIEIQYSNGQQYKELFQASSFLLKGNEIVAKDYDPIVGLMSNREPRTLMGLRPNNQVVFVVVEGRQPGISIGVTGEESAEILQLLGCTDGVLLDGGASSTMVYEGKVINTLYRDKERTIGHGIMIDILE